MQIVIEIPEEEYQTYINHTEAILDSSIPLVHQDLLMAVINGTPLPKGHGDLIDRSKIYKAIPAEEDNCTGAGMTLEEMDAYNEGIDAMYSRVQGAPTIIEADGGDTETWNGYHGRGTVPKGTFKRIYEDADGGDAE